MTEVSATIKYPGHTELRGAAPTVDGARFSTTGRSTPSMQSRESSASLLIGSYSEELIFDTFSTQFWRSPRDGLHRVHRPGAACASRPRLWPGRSPGRHPRRHVPEWRDRARGAPCWEPPP